jgi:hypothetical protein
VDISCGGIAIKAEKPSPKVTASRMIPIQTLRVVERAGVADIASA